MSKQFPKIAILILNWNGKKDTLECLYALKKVSYPRLQTIVIDNGSSDDSEKEIRAAFPSIPILQTGANLGFASGNNRGIEWALRHGAEWILLLNNDTIPAPDFLDGFLKGAEQEAKAKILGAKILRYGQPELVDHLGGFWDPRTGQFSSPEAGQADHPYFSMKQADYVCGAAFFIHRSVPETIGLLEPDFFLFWEEADYCYRAKRAGFEIWTAPEAKVWHKVSSSFTGGKPHMHYFWWRSRLLWIERNCTLKEKKTLYRNIIVPELWKMGRHCLLKSGMNWIRPNRTRKEKIRRLRAGCAGAFDFFRRRFGNCPSWVLESSH